MKIFRVFVCAAAVLLACSVSGFPEDRSAAQKAALESLAGSVSYGVKSPYSQAIDDVYLGYDKDGKPNVGAALRKFKTFKVVYALLVVERRGETYVVKNSTIPDISLINDKEKQDKIMKAASDFSGKTVKNASGIVRVDAVSGATPYYKSIYATFNLMAGKIVEEMEKNPPWEKQALK
jgi:hypothetical protein